MEGMPLSLGPEDRTSSGPRTAVPAGPGVPEDAARRAAELRSILERANVEYYVHDAPTLPVQTGVGRRDSSEAEPID